MINVKNILVPTDFEQTSMHALTYGRELARLFTATIHIVHAVDDVFALPAGTEGTLAAFPQLQQQLQQTARTQIERLMTDEERKSGTKAVVLTSSSPVQSIVDYARDAQIDLIVMGTHGRGGAPAVLIGSVAERVVRTAPCPVLTVRHSERDFVRPEK
jgi:nucleotide-binding universal stress UspA family protein